MYLFVALGYELKGLDEGKRGHNRDVWGSEGPLVDGAVAIMLCYQEALICHRRSRPNCTFIKERRPKKGTRTEKKRLLFLHSL